MLYTSNTEPELVRICPKWILFYDLPHSILIQNNCALDNSCLYTINLSTVIVFKKVSTFLPNQLLTGVHFKHRTKTCQNLPKMNGILWCTSFNTNTEWLCPRYFLFICNWSKKRNSFQKGKYIPPSTIVDYCSFQTRNQTLSGFAKNELNLMMYLIQY